MEPLVLPLTVDGTLKTAGLRDTKAGEESGTVLRAKVWLAPKFALNSKHLELLLEMMGQMGNTHARKVAAAITRLDLREAFPLRVHLPLPLTVWAQITCTDFKLLDANREHSEHGGLPADWFTVPQSYEKRDSSVEEYLAGPGGDYGGF